MMTEKRFYIIKDMDDKLIAIFVNEEDCEEFFEIGQGWSITELVI